MATNITLVSLSQMVDISLNCHEGIINFQALHTLFNVIIQQLSLNDVAVEFRGLDSDRIQGSISTMKSHTSLYPEYTIVGEKGKRTKRKKPKSLKDVLNDKKKTGDKTPSVTSPEGTVLDVETSDLQTVVVVGSESSLPLHSIALSKTTFDDLLSEIAKMKEQIKELTSLPTNANLIDAVKTNSGPVLDMFNIINLTKRMDAAEQTLVKMSSLLEDLAKNETGEMAEKLQDLKLIVTPGSRRSSVVNLDSRITEIEKIVQNILTSSSKVPKKKGKESDGIQSEAEDGKEGQTDDKESYNQEEKERNEDEDDKKSSRSRKSGQKSEGGRIKMFTPQRPFTSVMTNVNMSEMAAPDAQMLTQEEFKNLNDWINESIQEFERAKIFGPSSTGDVDGQIIDDKFQEYANQIKDMNTFYKSQIASINERFNVVQADMKDVITKMQTLPGSDSTGITAEKSMDLATKLELLEKEILNLYDQAANVEEQKKESDAQTQNILEQIDLLKIVKANREELEDALGDKADMCAINRKVSHDQFENTCDSLTQGIEEALHKLQHQEQLWNEAFHTIHKEIGNKLDKVEVDPIKDFVNNKLKALQERFKALTALKKEQESSATRMKLLKNVNCIACDKDVVMKTQMDSSLKANAYAMPPNRSMAPYLAYELDSLRKQQKCVPGGKNLNFVENALKLTRGHVEKGHICNRYCGGSHTVTTPQQRVTRLGHFLEQWGPEIAPLQDEYVKGNDKQMYKARDSSILYKTEIKDETKRPSAALNKHQTPISASLIPQKGSVDSNVTEQISKDEEQRDVKASSSKNYNIGSVETQLPTENTAQPSVVIAAKLSETRSSKSSVEPKLSQSGRDSKTLVPRTDPKESKISTESRHSRVQIVEPTKNRRTDQEN